MMIVTIMLIVMEEKRGATKFIMFKARLEHQRPSGAESCKYLLHRFDEMNRSEIVSIGKEEEEEEKEKEKEDEEEEEAKEEKGNFQVDPRVPSNRTNQ